MNPLVSIIMPTYNRADLIAETIDSIRKQTYPNWELLIMDDGSTDDTEKEVQKIADKRIRFYKNAHSGITGRLKNLAFEKSRGDLVAFLDSDDLWPPQKLEKQAQALLVNNAAGFCITNGYNFRKKGIPEEVFYLQTEGQHTGNIFLSIFEGTVSGFIQSMLAWKKCIQTSGLFYEKYTFNDSSFLINLAYHFNAVILFEPLLFRRLHQTNTSGSGDISLSQDYLDSIRYYARKKLLPGNVSNKALFSIYINIGEGCILRKERIKATARFIYAWKYKPFSIVPLKKIAKTFVSILQ